VYAPVKQINDQSVGGSWNISDPDKVGWTMDVVVYDGAGHHPKSGTGNMRYAVSWGILVNEPLAYSLAYTIVGLPAC
jgi:hypothetical protein